jgi:hypothetical protein
MTFFIFLILDGTLGALPVSPLGISALHAGPKSLKHSIRDTSVSDFMLIKIAGEHMNKRERKEKELEERAVWLRVEVG